MRSNDAFRPSPDSEGNSEAAPVHSEPVRIREHGLHSELEQAKRDLEKANALLIHSARLASLGELTAGVVHELNQPLNAIKIIAQSLVRQPPSDPTDLELDHRDILSLVNKLAATVDHMRTFSRRGEDGFRSRTIPNQLVQNALKLVGAHIRELGVELQEELADDLPPVYVDVVRLEQVILNLLTNARDSLFHSEQSDPRVRVRTNHFVDLAADCRWVVVEVEDNGPGISEEAMSQLFEPFFTTKNHGTGLGLALAHRILKDHAGRIEVRSEPAKSTVFRLLLPAGEPVSVE